MFDKVKNLFASKPEPKKRVRKPVTKQPVSQEIAPEEEVVTPADIKLGKELFWGRYPHYPEMSTVYRKLFQKFKIDNTTVVKVYDSLCGADMCNIAAGNGPNIEYMCDAKNDELAAGHIKKMALSKKFIHIAQGNDGNEAQYFGHVFSFYPELDAESKVDWYALDDVTMPGGYVFLPKLVTNPKETEKKPSDKLADNISFYFYINLDHTAHWISVLEGKVDTLQNRTPQKLMKANKGAVEAFRAEVTKWAIELKRLKSGQIKIVTAVYKHDDE